MHRTFWYHESSLAGNFLIYLRFISLESATKVYTHIFFLRSRMCPKLIHMPGTAEKHCKYETSDIFRLQV